MVFYEIGAPNFLFLHFVDTGDTSLSMIKKRQVKVPDVKLKNSNKLQK